MTDRPALEDLDAVRARVRAALPPYDKPIYGDTSRGVQMGWDRARQAALDALEGGTPAATEATGPTDVLRDRLTSLREQWVVEGPPPGVSRWWDQRLAELDAVLEEQP